MISSFKILCAFPDPFLKLIIEPVKRLLRPLALADVAQHDAYHGRAVSVLPWVRGRRPRGGGRQKRPEYRPVLFHHPQFARLRLTGLKELFTVEVVNILVLAEDI